MRTAIAAATVATIVATMTIGGTGTAWAQALSADDRLDISEAVTGIGLFSDLHEWERVAALLADAVTTDYVSVFGGEPATVSRDELLGQWRSTLQGFDATQHLITNVAVTGSGDEAQTVSHVRATHWIDGQFWTVGGVYHHTLRRGGAGWQVNFMQIRRLYEEGDRAVLALAAGQ